MATGTEYGIVDLIIYVITFYGLGIVLFCVAIVPPKVSYNDCGLRLASGFFGVCLLIAGVVLTLRAVGVI